VPSADPRATGEGGRTPVERLNTFAFVALLGALVLSFAERGTFAVVAELVCRVAVVALVAVGLVRFRGDYFSHWTSYLAAAIAVLSVFRIGQVTLLG
jgi:hypothetical protein